MDSLLDYQNLFSVLKLFDISVPTVLKWKMTWTYFEVHIIVYKKGHYNLSRRIKRSEDTDLNVGVLWDKPA